MPEAIAISEPRSTAAFLVQNVGTILVAFVLIIVVFIIIRKLIKDKKAGKSSCGCDCSSCGGRDLCHRR